MSETGRLIAKITVATANALHDTPRRPESEDLIEAVAEANAVLRSQAARIADLEAEVARLRGWLGDAEAAIRNMLEASDIGEAYARGFAAAREAAAAAAENEKPDVTAKSSLITQGKALGISLAIEAIRALRPEEPTA